MSQALTGVNNANGHHHCLGFPKLVRRNRLNAPSVLKALKIEAKYTKPFFATNEARLDYIYYDFEKAARLALAKAHPDVGGDTECFQNLLNHVRMVRRSFGRVGIGADNRRSLEHLHKGDKSYWRNYNERWKFAMSLYSRLRYLMQKEGAL